MWEIVAQVGRQRSCKKLLSRKAVKLGDMMTDTFFLKMDGAFRDSRIETRPFLKTVKTNEYYDTMDTPLFAI